MSKTTVAVIPQNPFAKRAPNSASSNSGGNYLDLFALPPASPPPRAPAADDDSPVEPADAPRPAPAPPAPALVPVSKILPYLWLGGIEAAQDSNFVKENNIKLIINLSQTQYWCSDPTVTVLSLDVADRADSDILTPLKRAIPMLNKAKDRWAATATPRALVELEGGQAMASAPIEEPPRVLVHCQKGVSRSVSVVVAFLMHQNGWSVTEALEFVQRKRPQAQPNMGFMEQLQSFYDLMTAKGEASYNRAAIREQLCMLLRNIPDSVSSQHIETTLEPFGEVYKVERFDTGLCAIFFTTKQGRRWAEKAVVASAHIRVSLSQSTTAPAQHVRMPTVAKRNTTTSA